MINKRGTYFDKIDDEGELKTDWWNIVIHIVLGGILIFAVIWFATNLK